MSINERLAAELKDAMKQRDNTRVTCIRMLRSKIQEREVALRTERGKEAKVSDEEAIEVIAAYAKQRRDSIEAYEKGGRDDLVASEKAELEIVSAYLPRQLSEEELTGLVQEAVEESGASSVKDMGAVMKLVMPKVKGRADGKLVNQVVRKLLG